MASVFVCQAIAVWLLLDGIIYATIGAGCHAVRQFDHLVLHLATPGNLWLVFGI
jgi:hypothetical protein